MNYPDTAVFCVRTEKLLWIGTAASIEAAIFNANKQSRLYEVTAPFSQLVSEADHDSLKVMHVTEQQKEALLKWMNEGAEPARKPSTGNAVVTLSVSEVINLAHSWE